MKKSLIKWLLPSIVIFSACKKDHDAAPAPDPVLQPAKGIYVLSEGGPTSNNSMLAYRDAASGNVYTDYFMQQNPSAATGLGDIANDMVIYGSKLYIVMNGSGNVTVLNASNGAYITRIPFTSPVNRSPRYALGVNGRLYVSAWDNKVSVIDTSTFSIISDINVGATPEGMAVWGNSLYVANSGGLNYPNYDSTVSVVDLGTGQEIKKIKVGLNPQKIEVNSQGKVYVTAYGDGFATVPVPASVTVIDGNTNLLQSTLGADYQYDHLRILNDTAYFYNNYAAADVKLYNTITNTLIRESFITDGTSIMTSYGLDIDEQNGDVYISDAKDFVQTGEVFCFNRNGSKKFSFSLAPAVNPNRVLFVR